MQVALDAILKSFDHMRPTERALAGRMFANLWGPGLRTGSGGRDSASTHRP